MRRPIIAVTIVSSLTLAACEAREPVPRFEVRGLQLKTDDGQYGISYSFTGSLMQTHPADDPGDYIVVMEFVRLSGGDPGKAEPDTMHSPIFVRRGIGEIELNSGFKPKPIPGISNDPLPTWEPARFSARPLGYVRFRPLGRRE